MRLSPAHDVKQPAFFVPAARFCARVFASLLRSPQSRVGGAPIRHPCILTSPQVSPSYFSGLAFSYCAPSRRLYDPQGTPFETGIRLRIRHAGLEQAFRLFRTKHSS